jgi:hypothetical protein
MLAVNPNLGLEGNFMDACAQDIGGDQGPRQERISAVQSTMDSVNKCEWVIITLKQF